MINPILCRRGQKKKKKKKSHVRSLYHFAHGWKRTNDMVHIIRLIPTGRAGTGIHVGLVLLRQEISMSQRVKTRFLEFMTHPLTFLLCFFWSQVCPRGATEQTHCHGIHVFWGGYIPLSLNVRLAQVSHRLVCIPDLWGVPFLFMSFSMALGWIIGRTGCRLYVPGYFFSTACSRLQTKGKATAQSLKTGKMGRMFPQANSSHRFWAPLVEIHYLNNNTIIQVKKGKKKDAQSTNLFSSTNLLNSTNLN